ncbi:MAG: proprotein convertase P-domain-containing protein, partial [Gammaproteobacteria bacterium]|nr:proprotein convertase P-domain-containing protein [Gammaproteobacteria bacterium]
SLGFSSLIPEFSNNSMPDLLATGTKLLRDGRGMVYVKASGDAFERCNRIGHPIHTELGCHSATTHPLANSPYVVVTGAFDSTAHRANYSTSGSNLWIVAPAGSNEDSRAGVITTDQFGEPRGYASTLPDLLNSRPSDNPHFDHTSTFQGTGAATAMVVGGIALLLEEQPELTFREVKHVLANTARQLEPEIHPTRIVIDATLVNIQDGWIENGAGYHFHNEYGFGAIDIDSAIDFATTFESGSLGLFAVSEWIEPTTNENPQEIPDADGSGLVTTVEIDTPIAYENCDSDDAIPHCVEANAVVLGPNNESISLSVANVNIESLQVRVRLDHSRPADLGLRLTSPFGTSSIVNPVFNNSLVKPTEDVVEYTFLTNAFYGENPVGEWTLEVVDVEQANTGILIDWYLKLYVGQHHSSTP